MIKRTVLAITCILSVATPLSVQARAVKCTWSDNNLRSGLLLITNSASIDHKDVNIHPNGSGEIIIEDRYLPDGFFNSLSSVPGCVETYIESHADKGSQTAQSVNNSTQTTPPDVTNK